MMRYPGAYWRAKPAMATAVMLVLVTAGCGSSSQKTASGNSPTTSAKAAPGTNATAGTNATSATNATSGSGSSGNQSPWVIGELSALGAGPFESSYGEVGKGEAAFVAYQNEVHGGVFGRKLVLNAQNDNADPTQAVQGFHAINDANAIVLTGMSLDSSITAVSPLVENAKISVLMGPSQADDVATNPYYHTAEPGNSIVVDNYLAFFKSQYPADSIVAFTGIQVANVKAINALGNADAAKYGLKGAGGDIELPITDTNYATQAQALVAEHPVAIATYMAAVQAVPLWTALQAAGYTGDLWLNEGAISDSNMAQIGSSRVGGAHQFVPPSVTSNAGIQRIQSELAKMKNPPTLNSAFAVWGWEIGQIVANTLQACGQDCTRTSFTAALKTLGTFSCDDQTICAGWDLTKGFGDSGFRYARWDPTTKSEKYLSDTWVTP